ncbi:MAG: dihydroorotate dehydrogenase electron transfer subunit [Bacteroidota bacterium]|nr:dihydroorotate dehydrogenase electron transfer subunit [Bacteroidota bacterium]
MSKVETTRIPEKKLIQDFTVIQNIRLNARHFILELQSPDQLPGLFPGQFVQVLVEHSPSTFLRRPFSIHEVNKENRSIRLLIQIKGHGTETLSHIHILDKLNLIYPLGNFFTTGDCKKVLLAGGGCGVAPLLFLAQELNKKGIRPIILTGWKTKADIFEAEKYQQYGELLITTEDGSEGEKGLVTQHSIFRKEKLDFERIYCCGPDPMMKAIGKISKTHGIDCEVSLENTMACGFGVCLCCVTPTIHGNQRVCTEGPVFNTNEL